MVMFNKRTAIGRTHIAPASNALTDKRPNVTRKEQTSKSTGARMPPNAVLETLALLWPLLQSSGVQTAIAGGIALSYWGNPRSTQDIDLAILSNGHDAFEALLKQAGFQQRESSTKELGLFILSQWQFEPADHFVAVDIDLLIAADEYYQTAVGRAKSVTLPGMSIPVAVLSREDLILHKLYASRLIDQADVLNLMEMHWDDLDQSYLTLWAQNLKLNAEWQTATERFEQQS